MSGASSIEDATSNPAIRIIMVYKIGMVQLPILGPVQTSDFITSVYGVPPTKRGKRMLSK